MLPAAAAAAAATTAEDVGRRASPIGTEMGLAVPSA